MVDAGQGDVDLSDLEDAEKDHAGQEVVVEDVAREDAVLEEDAEGEVVDEEGVGEDVDKIHSSYLIINFEPLRYMDTS